MDLSIKTLKFEDGERAKMLFDNKRSEYLFYPNVYITDQIRKTGGALSTMEQALGDIKFFLTWCKGKGIDFESRITHRDSKSGKASPAFLTRSEVNQLAGDCKLKIVDLRDKYQVAAQRKKGVGLLYLSPDPYEHIELPSEHSKITRIANYMDWLQGELLHKNYRGEIRIEGEDVTNLLRNFRPRVSAFSGTNPYEKGFDDKALELILNIVDPDSDINPFIKRDRVRNRLIVDLFRGFGFRAGELLKLRCHDFDFGDELISVTRVRNDKYDTRAYEPRTKTLARDLPSITTFMHMVREYIVEHRASIKGSDSHPYLLVSSGGPTRGQPLSQKSVSRIFSTIKNVNPEVLDGLSPHDMRHRWNYDFSSALEERIRQGENISSEEQRVMRNQNQGWSKNSWVSLDYNKQHDYEKAQEAALDLQNSIVNQTNLSNIISEKN